MTFKNDLERKCFEIAGRALGNGVAIEHNKTIQIEQALFPEVASFKGPPTKEVDVLVAELLHDPKVVLLVSCKLLSRRAEPAHVQEWGAVVQTMNKYADGTIHFGLIVSPTGLTSGCEPWATSHNIGILPPLKGRRLEFAEDRVLRMFERTLVALRARVQLQVGDLQTPPAFFDFVYRLVADFEGHEEATQDGRYSIVTRGWASSFGEMCAAVTGRVVEDLLATDTSTVLRLSGDVVVEFDGARVQFGSAPGSSWHSSSAPGCWKNLGMDSCTFDFVKSQVVGKRISSAGDFGAYLEFGLDQRFNLGLHPVGFHLISTESPISEHQL